MTAATAAAARDEPDDAADGLRDNLAIAQLGGLGRRFVGRREAPNPDPAKPPRKVPVRPRDGRAASVTDPDDWGTLDEALEAFLHRGLSGVGVVLGDGLAGADFDTCLDPGTGTLAPWARSWIGQLASYAEVSPSGTGVKALFLVDPVPELRAHKRTMGKGANGAGHPPAIEFYTGGRFFTLTGRHLAGTPDEVTDATEAAERLAAFVAGGRGDAGPAGRAGVGETPEALAKLLEDEPELKAAWASGEKLTGGTDDSASGLDYSLVVWLASRGYGDAVIEAALRHYPHGQIRKLGGKAADRRIKQLLAEAAKHRDRAGGDDDAPWPEPDMSIVDPHRRPAPALPLAVFGPFWSGWIEEAAAAKGASPDFVAMPLLTCAGSMLARSRRAQPWPGWKGTTILWTANVGPPSSGKSPAADAVLDAARRLEAMLNEAFAERMRRWRTDALVAKTSREKWEQAVRAAVKNGAAPPLMPEGAEEPEPPARGRLILNDVTPEQLVRLSAVNPHGLTLFRDELAGWLGGMDRYGGNGSERALWLEAFGARPYTVDRVKHPDPIHTDSLAVGICGGIQPDRLATLLLGGDDDGLAARLIFSWPEPRPPVRPERTPDEAAAADVLARLLGLSRREDGQPKVLPFADAAADVLQEWRVDVACREEATAGLFRSWVGKLPGHAVRLAQILEHLWWCGDRPSTPEPVEVGEDAVLAAVGFLESYALPMAERTFGDAAWPQALRDAAALAKWILAQKPRPEIVNARTLRKKAAIPGCKEAERYDDALEELRAADWVRQKPSRGGGADGGRRTGLSTPALAAGHERPPEPVPGEPGQS